MKYIYKQSVLIIFIIVIICGAIFSFIKKDDRGKIVETIPPLVDSSSPISMCYYLSNKTTNELYDVAWLKMEINGTNITGEFQNLPAETDSKVGTFKGTVGPLDQSIMGRHANVLWDSLAEGMNVKEELLIEFGDVGASVAFGEMVDRGDGVYVYKDKANLYYIDQIPKINCEYLDEKLFVEKYVRDNIKTIVTDKPVLGGTWYVTTITINLSNHTGEVTYEDGHIQSKANFTYIYKNNPQNITIIKFEIKK